MRLARTPGITDLLERAGSLPGPEAATFKAAAEAATEEVEWGVVKGAQSLLGEHGQAVRLCDACAGSRLALHAPQKRTPTPEFQKVLDQRRQAAEQQAYNKMVEDVSQSERKADARKQPLGSNRLQLGFGIHMGVTMLLGWYMGGMAGEALSQDSPALKHLGSVLGVVAALILETVLYIARVSGTAGEGTKYMRYTDPKKFAALQKGSKPDPKGFFQSTPGGYDGRPALNDSEDDNGLEDKKCK